MNKQEIKVLNEIIDNMDKILVEKGKIYQNPNGWKLADLTFLKAKLVQQTNNLFLPSSIKHELRILTHIFNYTFFLYYRYKQLSIKPFKLS